MSARMKYATTRREFVMELAGAAFVCKLSELEGIAKAVPNVPENREKLVAPCGLYCGACPMYIATQEKDEQKAKALLQRFSAPNSKIAFEDLRCDGCIGGGRTAMFCRTCNIRDCAEKKQKVTRCSDCKEFPCSIITNFNKDGMLHHAEVLENCRRLKDVGIKEWAKMEEERWSCPQCRAGISWYDATCSRCGAKRSDRLFPLTKA